MTTIPNTFFGTIAVQWKRNGNNTTQIVGLTVNDSQIGQNQLKELASNGLYARAKYNNLIYIKFKDNDTLEIYD